MNVWSTFRYVPPIAPQAMAWAVLSFACFLAASEMQPVLWGQLMDPLALALAIQLTLSITSNLTSQRFARVFALAPRASLGIAASFFLGFGVLACFGTASVAAFVMVLYLVLHAAVLTWGAAFAPAHRLQRTWTQAKVLRRRVVLMEAAGVGVSAATLVSVWTVLGPLAFAAMMTFGLLVIKIFVNWIIVLYLLDTLDRKG